MLECLVLGDSLAVGVGQIRKECVTYAKSGINSYAFVNRFVLNTNGNNQAKTIIISLGSNDVKKLETYDELDTLRHMIKADRVYWILPNIKEDKRRNVQAVAEKYKDFIIDARKHEVSGDGVHPTYNGYKSIANETRSSDR